MNSLPPKKDRCNHVKADGNQCQARPLCGSKKCFFHETAKAHERLAAQQAGGKANRKPVACDLPDRTLHSPQDLIELLADTVNLVRRGELEPRIANAVGYLSSTLLRAIDQAQTETRLKALMRAVVFSPQPRPHEDITSMDHLATEDDTCRIRQRAG